MKKLIIAISIMACGGATVLAKPPCTPVEVISTNITTSRTLDANVLYRIQGCVSVNSNVKLTIPAGTIITFKTGDYLFFEKDSEIEANGTAADPVVFTSAEDPGNRVGIEAGVYFLGNGTVNQSSLKLPCDKTHTSGSDNTGSSGKLSYVQFHYLSGKVSPTLPYMDNGLSFIGVGSATIIEHIEMTNSLNNGLAALGGKPIVNNAYALDNRKNQVYAGLGTQMELMGLLAMTRDAAAHQSAGTNGMLIENNRDSATANPWTNIKVNNSSLIGPKHCDPGTPHPDFKNGIVFDNNGGGDIYNTIITSYNEYGLYIDEAESAKRTKIDILNASFNSFSNNGSYDYGHGLFVWYGNGCDNTMDMWIGKVSGTELCIETDNQFDLTDIGYHNSFCGPYCDELFNPNFTVTETTELDAPSSSSVLDDRGSVQFNNRFNWIETCPQNYTYCTPAPLEKASLDYSLQIAPNPVQNQANLMFEAEAKGNIRIVIFDKVTGKTLYQKNMHIDKIGEQGILISVKGITEGIYPIRIEMKNKILNGKISVE